LRRDDIGKTRANLTPIIRNVFLYFEIAIAGKKSSIY